MSKDLLEYKRKSFMEIGEIFFWTATINRWHKLLQADEYKDVIISSLNYLSNDGKIDVFVPIEIGIVMPNPRLTGRAGYSFSMENKRTEWKRNSTGSFLKYTAHEFRKMLYRQNTKELLSYQVNAINKQHEFWQRDSLAIWLYNGEIAFKKLDYIHYNPVSEHWQLVKDPCEYKYSSAAYYELNKMIFPFLKI